MKRACFILFGENPASEAFVARKVKKAAEIGVDAHVVREDPKNTDEALEILNEVLSKNYDGIVVQLPLPAGVDTEKVINSIPPELDIDLLSTEAKRRAESGESERLQPVVYAIKELLERQNINLSDKKIVILGQGKLVGKPVASYFKNKGVPFKVVDADTEENERLEAIKDADVLISGIGVPHYVKPEMIKSGSVLVDAGTSEQAGKFVGDIDPECAEVASYLSPVPGGVGPLTIEGLFKNLFIK